MRRVLLALLLVAVAAVVVRGQVPCALLESQPACDVVLLPGPTANTLEIVTIDGQDTFESAGQLRLTTVAVDGTLGWGEWIQSLFSSTTDTVDREVIYPSDQSEEDVAEQNALLMDTSQTDATVAGLVAAGYDAGSLFAGARIVEVAEEAAEGADALAADDVIIAVDDTPVRRAQEAVDAVAAYAPGDTVTLRLEDGREETLVARAHPDDPDRALLGLLLEDALDVPFGIEFDAGNIGGPSAGLMFALGIVDLLGPEDLTGGATVAGTGTIDDGGRVGPIGGIRQKLAGATSPEEGEEPASVFLVPQGNFAEARTAAVASDILLVPVATIDDAVQALRDLARGAQPDGAVALGP